MEARECACLHLCSWRGGPRSGRLTLRAISSPRHAQTSVVERRNVFLRAAKILRERTQEFAGVEFHETTSSQMWAGFEITLAADSCVPLPAVRTRPDEALVNDARSWYTGSKRRLRPRRLRSEEKSPRRIATSALTSSGVRTASSSELRRGMLRSCEYSLATPNEPRTRTLTLLCSASFSLAQRSVLQPIMAGNAAVLKTRCVTCSLLPHSTGALSTLRPSAAD